MDLYRLVQAAWSVLRGGWTDPINYFGATFRGTYQLETGIVSGWVCHTRHVSDRTPDAIVVVRAGETVASTSEFSGLGRDWRFTVNVEFTPEDVLRSRLQVFALDRLGARSELLPDGASQLPYIRHAFGRIPETELAVDFSQKGNSANYIGDGWYPPTSEHAWTCGNRSFVNLPLEQPGVDYCIEMSVWPFVAPKRIPEQRLEVLVNGYVIGKSYLKSGTQILDYTIPAELTREGKALIQLNLPDAARPCDVSDSRDGRILGLAVQKVVLKRVN